jgi:ATP-binding cassette, subfamily B, bacterial PglK
VTKEGNIRVVSDLLIQLPSHVIEVVAVICLSFLIFLILLLETSTVNIIAIIAIFAAAITRIMPASTRMIHHIQSLRYYLPRVNIVRNELRKKTQDTTTNKIKISRSISFNKHIELKNISFFYKKKNNAVFSNLNLKIKKMETIGILGPSGSGKSTLNNIITGLLKPKNGKVNIDEVNIDVNLNDWQKKIGFVPQQPFFTNDTIKKNIIFTENTSKVNTKLLNRSIKYSQLGTLIKELPLGLNTQVGERGIVLSSGQLQRISIARALYRNPQLLILDEATNALDAKNEKLFFESVRNLKGKLTVIINSHQKHNFYFCDKIYEIKNKKLKKVAK